MKLTHKISPILQNKGLKRYFFNTFWLFATQGVRLLSGFFVGLWIARYLGPEDFGLYNYIISIIAIFLAFATFGTSEQIVKDLAQRSCDKSKILNAAFYLRVVLGFLSIVTLCIGTAFSKEGRYLYYIFICTPPLIFQAFDLIDVFYRSTVNGKKASMVKISQIILSSILKIYCIQKNFPLEYFFLIFSFDYVSYGLSLYLSFRKLDIPFLGFKPDFTEIKRILKTAWPLMIMGLASILLSKVDQIIVANILNNTEVGYYVAAYRLIEIINTFPIIVFSSIFIAILNAKNRDYNLYNKRLLDLSRLLLAISVFFTACIYCFSNEIIHLLYKESYSQSAPILKILSLNIIFGSMFTISSHWYIAEGLNKLLMTRTILACIFNTLLNWVMVPYLKVEGAALSSILSHIIFYYLYDYINPRTRRCFFILSGVEQNKKFSL